MRLVTGPANPKMRLPIWSHDSNPSVDPRLCKQSFARCESEVAAGSLRWVDPRNKTKGCIVVSNALDTRTAESECFADSVGARGALSLVDALANVGIAGAIGTTAPVHLVRRAQQKIRAYPHVHDDLAVTASGRYQLTTAAITSQLKATALPCFPSASRSNDF